VDGRKLESINQWFNKESAALQSIKDLQGIKQLTQCQSRLYINRSSQVRDDLNKAARLIIHHCIDTKIERLIVGFNIGMKDGINSRNNQNVVQIPFYSLTNKLKSLCEGSGLVYQEQEESYKGHLINSHTNDVANIGRNSKQNGLTRLSRGCLAQPLRIKVY